MNQHFTRMPTHALLDFSSKAILAIDRFPGVIAFLTDCTPHSFAVFNINIPNYLNESPLKDTSPEQYPEWVFDPASRVVKKNPSPNVDMLRDKSKLAMHKGATILPIMRNIIIARYDSSYGIASQDTIYLSKKLQAILFRDCGYDETRTMEIPYVVQYADYAGIPLKQAADDIVFKAALTDQRLSQTELMRMTYFNKVKKATTEEDLSSILKYFLGEMYHQPLGTV